MNYSSFRFHGILDIHTVLDNMIWLIISFIPSILTKRKIIVKNALKYLKISHLIFGWIRSDFFIILAIVFVKIHLKSLVDACKRQSLKTFGTYPMLVLIKEFEKRQ